jgi:preprotein translocase subunit YajC
MLNALRLSKYIIPVIMIIAVIWIVCKKTKAMKLGENRSNGISGFDRVMIGVTGIMGKIVPSSPFTREMKTQKETFFNHL